LKPSRKGIICILKDGKQKIENTKRKKDERPNNTIGERRIKTCRRKIQKMDVVY